jgi:carboxyl-terminal processing protease
MVAPSVTARELGHGIAYVRLFEFSADASSQVFTAIKRLHLGTTLRGVVLDLRGNPGGTESQAVEILSAFDRNAVVGFEVQGSGKRAALSTDNAIPYLHVPLVVLTDSDSASASEVVAAAVRDLHLGEVVGGRTAGELAGAYFYSLSDGSSLEITAFHVLGPKGERIDGVGVPPNQQIMASAGQLSAGHDPVIDQAVHDIRQG